MRHQTKRPFGVTVIIVIILLTGILTLLELGTTALLPPDEQMEIYSTYSLIDISSIVILPVQIILAFGLYHLRQWAWLAFMLGIGISMSVNLWTHFDPTQNADYLLMLLDVVMVFYLNQRDVHRAFGYMPPNADNEGMLA